MNLLPFLFLAHFLADYNFQWAGLVDYKKKSWIGLLIHSAIHVITSAVIVFPFLNSPHVWFSLGVIFVSHTVTDFLKIALQKRFERLNRFLMYLLDQVVHLLVILALSVQVIGLVEPAFTGDWVVLYSNPLPVSYWLALVLTTYFYDISLWAYRNSLHAHLEYRRNYRLIAQNALIVTVGFAVYWFTSR